ncbi:MAG TPA: TetR/AcrR family transcriptional regulator [Enhygromyxa sp.]|nr:TetR/AcrR family transcriptional regulator [Enhygromyxa sp.]
MQRAHYHHGDLRQALLEVGLELIAERGPDGFTLREAARRIGVSHSAPYRHFADKDALLIAIAEAGFTELHRLGRAASDLAGDDPRARLRAFGEAYLRFAAEHPSQYRVMFGRAISKPTPALREAGDLAFGLLEAQVAEVLGRVDVHDLAMAVMAGVHGLAMLALDGMLDEHGERSRFAALSEVMLSLLDAGLASAGPGAGTSSRVSPAQTR